MKNREHTNCDMCGGPMDDPLHCRWCRTNYRMVDPPPMPPVYSSYYGVVAMSTDAFVPMTTDAYYSLPMRNWRVR